MNFPDALLSPIWASGAFLCFLPVLIWSVATAPWVRLTDSAQSNVWLGAIVFLTLVWNMKAGVKPGLNLHLLGATMFTLMFGRQLAIIGLASVLAAVTLNAWFSGVSGWQAYALNALVLIVVPVFVSDIIRQLMERVLPANFFIYIFIGAFFGAAASLLAAGVATASVLWLAGAYPADFLWQHYLSYILLLTFAEAWLNGAMITLMAVYLPHWLGSFDDQRYLLNN
ncbi:MAG: energy-coupling factor ABC transporter permease [Rugosibacter sp.]|nr:energy-coupling factor ABC transporter permease [Rugosibacter sp.]